MLRIPPLVLASNEATLRYVATELGVSLPAAIIRADFNEALRRIANEAGIFYHPIITGHAAVHSVLEQHANQESGGEEEQWWPDDVGAAAIFAESLFFAVAEERSIDEMFDPVTLDADALVSCEITPLLQDLMVPSTGFSVVFDFTISNTSTSLALLDFIQTGGSDDALDVSVGGGFLSASMGGGNYENNIAISVGRHVVGVTLNPNGDVDRVLDSGAADTSTVDGYSPGTHDEFNFFVQAGTNAHLTVLHIYSTPLSAEDLQAAVEALA